MSLVVSGLVTRTQPPIPQPVCTSDAKSSQHAEVGDGKELPHKIGQSARLHVIVFGEGRANDLGFRV